MTLPYRRNPLCCVEHFLSLSRAIFCLFFLSFFLPLPCFPLTVSASWQQGKSRQGERKAWPRKLLWSPSPCSSGVSCRYSAQPFPVLQAKESDVEMHSWLFSSSLLFFVGCFFFRRRHGSFFSGWTVAWPVQKNKTKQKISPSGISEFWFCFCLGLGIPFYFCFSFFTFCHHLSHCAHVCFAMP